MNSGTHLDFSSDAFVSSGSSCANIPWEDRPKGCNDTVWRYSKNPVIPRDLIECSNSIFNSAVVPYNGGFAGVFRCDDKRRYLRLHKGVSRDGINWEISNKPIEFVCSNTELIHFEYGFDPRVTWIEDRYYITWCNGYEGFPTIGVGYTFDFEVFYQLENAFLPFNRNGMLFPKKINGKYAMLSRPSDNGHTPFGDIFYSESPDMCHWGCHRHVMGPREYGWDSTKIGGGSVPIETDEGWLIIYHGVMNSCNGFVYSMGGAILDIDKPWKVIYRSSNYLLSPQTMYECVGDVQNVVFPCATLYDESTGKIAIYYGAADTVTALAFTKLDELVHFIKTDSGI